MDNALKNIKKSVPLILNDTVKPRSRKQPIEQKTKYPIKVLVKYPKTFMVPVIWDDKPIPGSAAVAESKERIKRVKSIIPQ